MDDEDVGVVEVEFEVDEGDGLGEVFFWEVSAAFAPAISKTPTKNKARRANRSLDFMPGPRDKSGQPRDWARYLVCVLVRLRGRILSGRIVGSVPLSSFLPLHCQSTRLGVENELAGIFF